MKGPGLEWVDWTGELETFGYILQNAGRLLLVTAWGSDKDA